MPFGQLVIGPPGSGKTTYCNGMQQYMSLLGRKVAVVNLDPANDNLPYECAIDVGELVSLEAVMESMHLGPNGGALEGQVLVAHCLLRLLPNLQLSCNTLKDYSIVLRPEQTVILQWSRI